MRVESKVGRLSISILMVKVNWTLLQELRKRLTQELKVVAGMGSEDDSLTSASGPVFQAEKCVFLTGSATTPTQPDIGEYIFMPAYGDHFQGTAVAKFIVDELGWKKR